MQKHTYAVVGASDDPNKFGNKVFKYLKDQGEDVTPIHPDNGSLYGSVRYRALAEMPAPPDTVITVVPPPITERVVAECATLKIPRVWMQPGSESDAAIALCVERGIEVVTHTCIMLQ